MDVQLQRRILAAELRARLPDATVRSFAPFGWERPIAADGGDAAEPLGRFTRERAQEIGKQLDLVIRIPGPHATNDSDAWARSYRVEVGEWRQFSPWFAVEPSDLSGTPVVDAPEGIGALAARWFPSDVIDRRRRFHAHMGWTLATLPASASLEDLVAVNASDLMPVGEGAGLADAGLDQLAALVDQLGATRRDDRMSELQRELDDLRRAFEARGERLAAERLRFSRHLDDRFGAPGISARAGELLRRIRRAVHRRLSRG